MKAIINKVLHGLGLGIIGIMLVLVLILILLYFADHYIETHHQRLEKFASVLIKQPVSVRKIIVRNKGLEPVLKFYDVAVFNEAKTKVLLQAQELQIGIDLIGSLFGWNIKPGLLVVRGANFSISQDKNGELLVSGIKGTSGGSASDTNFAFAEILKWLFEQSKIDLSDVVLTWSVADGEILKFSNLQLKLYNGVLQHELKINGRFAQKYLPAKFEADLKLRGEILKQAISSLTGDIVIENCLFKSPEQFSGGGFFVPPVVGDINLLLKHPKVIAKFFRTPLTVESIEGKIIWQNTKDNLDVRIDKFKYQDAWLALRGDLQFLFPPITPDQNAKRMAPVVDIQLEFRLSNLARAKLYYPVTELPPDATVWLDKAFISSKPMMGNMILKGPIDKFPFDHNEGRFLANANIRDVHLNYDDAWPPIEHLNGKLLFANRSMVILTQDAKIMQSPIGLIKATIPDLDIPILSIESVINSDSSAGLKFVNLSPLKETIANKLQAISLTGPMRLDLKMIIPLSSLLSPKEAKTKVDGYIALRANYLRPYELNFGLNNIQGELHFTENDLTANKLSGQLFDRPVELTVDTLSAKADTITRVTVTGSAAITDIEKGFSVKLNPYVAGDFKYRGLLELHDLSQSNVFKLNSDLQGITVDLPEPFAKAATGKSKFGLAYYFGGNKLSRIIVNYNDQINAVLAIKKINVKPWVVLIGEIKFGTAPAAIFETSGIVISGFIKKLDLAVWRSYLSKMENNFTEVGTTIRQIGLKVDELRVLGQVLKKVALQAKPRNNGWEIMLSMATIQGKIFFPLASGVQIQGVFQKLYLDSGKEQQNTAVLKPQDLAPLHFTIDDFRYDNKKFNRVEFVTQPQQPKGLEISKITITDPKFNLTASGNWVSAGDKQQTTLRGKISSVDIGGLLQQLKLTDDLIGGKGEADFSLKWPNTPYNPSLKEVEGTFVVRASNGQIINFSGKTEAKLGLSRVLNLFSLRHLSLDLSDLTKKGFGFDKLESYLEIAHGNAFARKINLDGPIAGVQAKGKIGLVMQDYDIRLSVTPHITSSVPVVVTLLSVSNPIGPLIGLASWVVADKIIAPAIKKATTYTYHITGSWDNPTIKKI
ncbi:conserved hypothetical protein [Gammaproteobacteria bacterium]